jgi:hypothetical protein
MKRNPAMTPRTLLLISLASLTLPSWAHEGHGLDGTSHYHATDVWGFVIMAGLMAIVWWFTGRGK